MERTYLLARLLSQRAGTPSILAPSLPGAHTAAARRLQLRDRAVRDRGRVCSFSPRGDRELRAGRSLLAARLPYQHDPGAAVGVLRSFPAGSGGPTWLFASQRRCNKSAHRQRTTRKIPAASIARLTYQRKEKSASHTHLPRREAVASSRNTSRQIPVPYSPKPLPTQHALTRPTSPLKHRNTGTRGKTLKSNFR